MTDKNTGGPAFPCEGGQRVAVGNDLRKTPPSQGMTLRDYFAAKAMQSILAVQLPEDELDTSARYAYAVADAMLEARND